MNKKCLLGSIPQGDLHVKILDLVAQRVAPLKEGLFFEKDCCHTCITHGQKSAGESGSQKNACPDLKKKREGSNKKELDKKFNSIHIDKIKGALNKSRLSEKKLPQIVKPENFPSSSLPSLSLETKVIYLQIDNTKNAEVEESLKTQVEDLNAKERLIEQLRGDLIEKENRINSLEKQLNNSKDHIKQLNMDIDSIRQLARNRPYSDNHLISHEVLSSEGFQSPSLKELIQLEAEKERAESKIPIEEGNYPILSFFTKDYLLRMVLAQAKIIQDQRTSTFFN